MAAIYENITSLRGVDLSDIKCWFKTYHSDTLTNLYNFSVTQDTPHGGIVLVSQMIVFYNRCSMPGSLRFREEKCGVS